VVVFECAGDQRLVNCIRKELGGQVGDVDAEELVHLGAVHVRKCKENKKRRVLLPWSRRIEDGQIRRGSLVRVHTQPSRFPVATIDWDRRLLFQDDDYLIIDKPAGIPYQATHDNFRECVVQVTTVKVKEKAARRL
jgi:23S rRNA-/tRNA-specific pseudouridylate synthase